MAAIRVIQGTRQGRRKTPLEDAYGQFRLERQGNGVSPATLKAYDYHLEGFFAWLARERPQVRKPDDLGIDVLRAYRASLATRTGHHGRPLAAETLQDSHASLRAFFRWSENEGCGFDPRILKLPRIRVPDKEPTVYTTYIAAGSGCVERVGNADRRGATRRSDEGGGAAQAQLPERR